MSHLQPAAVPLSTLPALHQLFLATCHFSQVTIPSQITSASFTWMQEGINELFTSGGNILLIGSSMHAPGLAFILLPVSFINF